MVATQVNKPEKPDGMLFNGRVRVYRVELLADWMGYPKGSKMSTTEQTADVLVSRGAARYTSIPMELNQSVDNDIPQPDNKALDVPPKDKMVRRRKIKAE